MYELLCIIPAIYTADEIKPVITRIEGILKAKGAEILKSENLGDLKFAYPIKKHSHGSYVLIDFNIDPVVLKDLDKDFRLEKDILRSTVSKKMKNVKDAKPVEFQKIEPGQKTTTKRDSYKKAVKEKESDKIKIEDINDKLEEILDKEIV